jgi:hypothetical protein
MEKTYISLIVSESTSEQIAAADPIAGVEVGRPKPADSFTNAVDAPLGPDEIKALLQIVTLSLQSLTAAIAFFTSLKKVLAKSGDSVRVVEAKTGRVLATVDSTSDPQELARRVVG